MKLRKTTLYSVILALSIMVLLISNLSSTKLFDFFNTGLILDSGAILFPLCYVLTNITTDIFGFKKSTQITFLAFAMNTLALLFLSLVLLLPPSQNWGGQDAFAYIVGSFSRVTLGSLAAYLCSQVFDAFLFSKIREKNSKLWFRIIFANLPADAIDTAIFSVIAFAGTISSASLLGLCILAFAVKTVTTLIFLPVTSIIIKTLNKKLINETNV